MKHKPITFPRQISKSALIKASKIHDKPAEYTLHDLLPTDSALSSNNIFTWDSEVNGYHYLKESKKFIIDYIPFKSTLFVYSIWGSYNPTYKIDNRIIFNTKRIIWKIKPNLTVQDCEILLKEINIITIEEYINCGLWENPQHILFSELVYFCKHTIDTFSRLNPIIKGIIWYDELIYLGQPPIKDFPEVHPFYHIKQLLLMSGSDIQSLKEKMSINPFLLCFTDKITFKHFSTTEKKTQINELSPKAYERLDENVCKLETLKLYNFIKTQTWTNKKVIIPLEQLSSFSRESINLLQQLRIIISIDTTNVMLTYLYNLEICFIYSLVCCIQTQSPPSFNKVPTLYTAQNKPFCDEQTKAFNMLKWNQLTIITGPGGSGKTDFIGALPNLYPNINNILAVSFQGNNVSFLNTILCKRAYTVHYVLYSHKNCQKLSHKGLSECIFQDIDLLVVDECFNLCLELLSKLIIAYFLCGRKKKILLCGDNAQLPPIQIGNPMEHLYQYFTNYTIEFTHNHRVDKNSKRLHEISTCIRNGMVDRPWFDYETIINIPTPVNITDILTTYNIKEHNHHVITRTNEARTALTKQIEQYYHNPCVNYYPNERTLYVGRKFSFTQNNYELDVYNNNIWILDGIRTCSSSLLGGATPLLTLYVKSKTNCYFTTKLCDEVQLLKITSENVSRIIVYDKWIKGHVKKASATTVNSFQGNQSDIILYYVPNDSPYETRERLYTAITRAKKQFFYIGDVNTFTQSISRTEEKHKDFLRMILEFYFPYSKTTFG